MILDESLDFLLVRRWVFSVGLVPESASIARKSYRLALLEIRELEHQSWTFLTSDTVDPVRPLGVSRL